MTSSFILINGDGTFGLGPEGFNTPLVECTDYDSLTVFGLNSEFLAESGGMYVILRKAVS